MIDNPFATLIFKGGRFQSAAMPLEALPELAPIDAQVESLRGLGADWFERGSAPLSADGLSWLASLLVHLLPGFELPTPYLYPTPEGHVRAEWSASRWDLYAEFDLTKRTAEVLASRVDSDEVHERELVLGSPGAEAQLGRFLVEHIR